MPDPIRFSTLNRSISGGSVKAFAVIGYDGTVHRSYQVDSCTLITDGNMYFYDIEFTAGIGLHETSTYMVNAYSLRRNVTSANADMGNMHGQVDIASVFDATTNIIRVIRRTSGNTSYGPVGDGDTSYTLYYPYDWDHGYANGQPEYIYIAAF